jgi:alpha/beta superfamily hydrolase
LWLLLQDFGLHKYASIFASHGIACFVFDYRGWGGSDGTPRHWLSARRHVADWKAAVRHVRANMTDSVDINKLCLWGTSFAGGHVLVVASDPEFASDITAVVTQVLLATIMALLQGSLSAQSC